MKPRIKSPQPAEINKTALAIARLLRRLPPYDQDLALQRAAEVVKGTR